MKPQNILGWTLEAFALLAVISILLLAIGVCIHSSLVVFKVMKLIFTEGPSVEKVILQSLKAIDAVLLGIVFFIIGIGLFELFIKPIDNLPEWLKVRDLDQLKAKMVKVIVVVMGVSFTGRVVTWDGTTDLLGYGLSLAAVVLALSYFLNIKLKLKKVPDSGAKL